MKSGIEIKKEQKLFKEFPITSVCRYDLEDAGFDIKNVDDDIMEDLASRMSEAYRELIFWIDLPILAEYAGIKKHKEVNEKTKE
ncbi:hypothetical protein A2643_00165 [Candidatus Nomurabacteria bacterium RIFCSPHIGHO2_01_FULL_39_220]|uniref:AdoMet activation domain-containing protein n=1 Tax=Candidatus Nomurabacteria bacterium RIFCSPLOWO2_02_FULL_40_67 TaxID=1801787 RepID=A0A1F6Y3R3_9BACT|nr:MAG: hypothetical protein UU01_C0014G0016 [Parcubacteria group bacterium GW2011_GWA2_40_37]KKS11712.1 MAG: hypothetical protein UU66_C0011G0013 [Parcubacteria group bacterium GW2011_GWB1_41_5]KKS72499.1 MAG: hypothetical protein UV43_C0016G0003 [Parcubacteria group bacterium GW2011_GWF2_42_7]OGI62620.1 MAG: hypothetical protein A2W12_00510 [Candidatus Nomurabacteria bacterium RBG_16_40_11]OGI69530.1 MAG: hypothetical protein A2643_00165 [Candidatus Nomurabacteria bacterium RIFCSPHIGHO2_01_FU